MIYLILSPQRQPVGRFNSDGNGELQITDPRVRSELERVKATRGGVLAGPEGPAHWDPFTVVDYLRRSGYELKEGTDGEQHADPHVSPDSGRVQVRRVATAKRP